MLLVLCLAVMKVQGEGHDKPRKPGRRSPHNLLPAVLTTVCCAAASVAPPLHVPGTRCSCAPAQRLLAGWSALPVGGGRCGEAERAASVLTRPSLTRRCVRARRCALLRHTRLPAEDELPIDINFTKMEDWLKERQKAKKFLKVPFIVTLNSKFNRALTFQN